MARSRFRSVSYDLDSCIALARVVAEAGGEITADVLAPSLGYTSANNGAFLTRLANARLFGLVAGRSGTVTLSERGRAVTNPEATRLGSLGAELFDAVPLFRVVRNELLKEPLPAARDLAEILCDRFGEVASKAPSVAVKLIDSAGQAGLLQRNSDGTVQFTEPVTDFTDDATSTSNLVVPQVLSTKGLWNSDRLRPKGSAGTKEVNTMWKRVHGQLTSGVLADVSGDGEGLWLDDSEQSGPSGKADAGWHRTLVIAIAVIALALVAVPVGITLSSGNSNQAAQRRSSHLGNGPAEHQVLNALSATTDSGSFNMKYAFVSTPGKPTTTSTTNPCYGSNGYGTTPGSGSLPPGVPVSSGSHRGPPYPEPHPTSPACNQYMANQAQRQRSVNVSGAGIIDTNPLAMVASARVGNTSNYGGLQVTIRLNSNDVWELGGGYYGTSPNTLPPGSPSQPTQTTQPSQYKGGPHVPTVGGQPLPGFANLVESTIGPRAGAVAMMGMASPTGYLDLTQSEVTGAGETGTGTVDGVSVTNYKVSLNLQQLVHAPGTSPLENKAIIEALGVLHKNGYVGTTATLSIDGAGFIRKTVAVTTFSDGGTASLTATFWNFGCAGTVLMPGQQGSPAPPANCVSPDAHPTGVAPTTVPVPSTVPSTVPSGGVRPTTTTSTSNPGGANTPTTSVYPPTTVRSGTPSSTTSTSTPSTSTSQHP
ncbi:MAG: hypothetical protein M1134_02465 [Actinobacteria bacterium]|nr:hypothetical protein [Actinomycetota bacterium]